MTVPGWGDPLPHATVRTSLPQALHGVARARTAGERGRRCGVAAAALLAEEGASIRRSASTSRCCRFWQRCRASASAVAASGDRRAPAAALWRPSNRRASVPPAPAPTPGAAQAGTLAFHPGFLQQSWRRASMRGSSTSGGQLQAGASPGGCATDAAARGSAGVSGLEVSQLPGEHQALHQEIAGQAVGAVHAGAGHFPHRVEPGKARGCQEVGGHAPHPVVRCRSHGNRRGRRSSPISRQRRRIVGKLPLQALASHRRRSSHR